MNTENECRKMRVVHFITSLDRSNGGTAAYMQLLAKELGRIAELHIVTHRSENPLTMENCKVHYIGGNVFGIGMKREWLKVLDEVKPDVVHVNCCWLPEIAMAQRWAQAKGYKVVLTPHGMLEPWIMRRHYLSRKLPAIWLFQRKTVRKADCIHATAESERRNLLSLGWNKNISVIPNGIDVDAIEMKRSWRRTGKILFLSRVHPKKGINFLIEAAALIKGTQDSRMDKEDDDSVKFGEFRVNGNKGTQNPQTNTEINDSVNIREFRVNGNKGTQNPQTNTEINDPVNIREFCVGKISVTRNPRNNTEKKDSVIVCEFCVTKYKFIIAGESYGNYVDELKQLACDKGVSDMFEFVGGVYGYEKWQLYREADLFVLPTHSENFGIVVAEALASGTPVITTKGTPWQELETEYCGWWTEVGAEPTAKALSDFLSMSEQDLERMGRNGRRLIEEKYSAKSVAAQMVTMYNVLISHETHGLTRKRKIFP